MRNRRLRKAIARWQRDGAPRAAAGALALVLVSAITLGCAPPPSAADDRAAFERGNVALDAEKPAEALAAFQEAVRARPDYGPTYYGLGRAYYGLGRYAAARDAFNDALRVEHTLGSAQRRAMVYEMLAQSYYLLGETPRARASIDQAIALDPTEPTIRQVERMIKG